MINVPLIETTNIAEIQVNFNFINVIFTGERII